MVDITDSFYEILTSLPKFENHGMMESKKSTSVTEDNIHVSKLNWLLPKCIELLKNLVSFERLLGSIVEEYVGYHRIFVQQNDRKKTTVINETERKDFDQEFALFVAMFIGEVNDLRESISTLQDSSPKLKDWKNHHMEIVNYLFDRLNRTSSIIQNMRKEREKYNIIPAKIHSTLRHKMFQSNRFISLPKLSSNIAPSSMSLSSSSIQATSSNSTQSKRLEKNSNIFDRYEGEIAPPAKLKQYQNIGDKYKQHLMKEAQELQAQYSEDIQHVQEVEESVERIASMLSEFVRILHIQTDQVEDIHDSSEEATESAKRSNRELQTTIDRSKSHQWNMVMLAISLAMMLLLLDWITP